ncbi:MAG: acyloxyacyl hydrolase [Planctomycetes bacterium]|nr:acyloxyacyl hydrolase [Planctomycetota bacterium]
MIWALMSIGLWLQPASSPVTGEPVSLFAKSDVESTAAEETETIERTPGLGTDPEALEFSFGLFTGRERSGKPEDISGFRFTLGQRFWLEKLFLRGSLNGYYLNDIGKDALAVGFDLSFRWYEPITPRWRLYAELSGGVFVGNHKFPQGGTEANFTYHGDLGVSYRLFEPTWVDLGIGFVHVSNGFVKGRKANPGSNGFWVYAGLTVPF